MVSVVASNALPDDCPALTAADLLLMSRFTASQYMNNFCTYGRLKYLFIRRVHTSVCVLQSNCTSNHLSVISNNAVQFYA